MEEIGLTRPILADESNSRNDNHFSGTATTVVVLSTAVALCGPLSTGCGIGFSSPAQAGIMEDLGLSLSAYSAFGSMVTIGGMIGGFVNGRLADHIGRKAAMWVSETLCIVGWFAIAFGKNAMCLDIGRVLLGISNGLICYAVPVYIAEITPKEIRGRFTSAYQLTLCSGIALMFFVGNAINWRNLAIIGAIPSLLHIFGLFFIPESPRWLAKVGKKKETLATLQRLRGKNVDISKEANDIIDYTEAFQQDSGKVLDLFQWRYAHALAIGIGLMALQQFSGNVAIITYAKSIFSRVGFSTRIGTVTMAITQIPAVAIGVLLADRLGRRPLLMISAAGMCFSCTLIGFSFLLMDRNEWNDLTPTIVFLAIQVYGMSFVMAMAGLPWVIMSEIFPINVKGSAGSLMTMVNWSCAWIITYSFNFTLQWSSSGTFFMYSIVAGLAVIFVAKLVPETKGKSLEEIQASMSHFVR